MRIELSRKAEYAIRAAQVLARHNGDAPLSAASITRDAQIPAQFAPHVLSSLARAGVVSSKEGAHGGYLLARPAAEISLLDLVEAVEGRLRSTRCVVRGLACSPENPCLVHPGWGAAQAAMRESMASSSLASMAGAG